MLDTKTAMGYVDPAAGKIRRSGFAARFTRRTQPPRAFGGLFVSTQHGIAPFRLGGRAGSLRARRVPCDRSANPHGSPFLRFAAQKGMTKPLTRSVP